MDKIDRRLLVLLQQDASRTNAELADLVGLSASSCLRRVRRLKEAGVIERIVAVLSHAKAGRRIKAIVTIQLERHGEAFMDRFLRKAAKEPAVAQAYSVSGETDAVLMLRLVDMDEFDAFCERMFDADGNVARYYTLFILRTAKETTAIPV